MVPTLTERSALAFVDAVPALNNQTVRVMLESTMGGAQVAVKLTNRFSAFPISIGAAHVAIRASGGAIASGTDRAMTGAYTCNTPLEPDATQRLPRQSMPKPSGDDTLAKLLRPRI